MTDSVQMLTANQLVALNMARLRKDAGLTQDQLGERLGGWSKVAVSAAERSIAGVRVKRFDIDEVVRIAGVFGVPVEELLKPPPVCDQCRNNPPEGFTCNTCGRSGS